MNIGRMGKQRAELEQSKEVTFTCHPCGARFTAEPGHVEDLPEADHHPFRYFANCPQCGAECEQAQWERALFKAWRNATGPRTAEGKEATSKNLLGHPTPDEALRTRFNAMKHGLFARTASYFPAKPGKYPQCDGCDYRDTICHEQVACLKRTELFMKHHIAFEARDPDLLQDLRADTQAAIQALINDMILAIAQDGGPRISSPQWFYDHLGSCHLVQFRDPETSEVKHLSKIEAHPLLKILMEFISKNSMSMADVGMTPRVQDDHDVLAGHLSGQAKDRHDLVEYQKRQAEALENLTDMIARSHERTRRDPVLIEHGEAGK